MAMHPVASVVIPAHNEARVIEACLRSILAGAEPGELEIVVACNGCTDGTAALAAGISDEVRVVETDVASKWGALNLGDEHATTFPRMYVDADVVVSERAIQRLAALMNATGAGAGAPTLRFSPAGQSWAVRSFYDTFRHSTYFEPPFVGHGFYAVSEEGRRRFGEFPASGADDLLIMEAFGPDERVVDDDSWFEPALPKSVKELYRVMVRQMNANLLREEAADGSGFERTTGASNDEWVRRKNWVVRRLLNPRTTLQTLPYVVLRPITHAHAWLKSRRGEFVWSRDSSSH